MWPMDSMTSRHVQTGRVAERAFDGPLAPDASRSRGDIQALLRAADDPSKPDADRRRWSFVGIGDLENGLRELARTKHADLIELRANSAVESIRQGDGWAEAVLSPSAPNAAADAVRGSMLVDASGRDLLQGPRTVYPERGFWLGGRFAPAPEGQRGTQRIRDAASGTERSTIALRSADRTLVWTQVDSDPTKIDAPTARRTVEAAAGSVGVSETLAQNATAMPVTVQLWTSDEPARGRVLKVGDSVRAPYFMTSTGAATALIHDTPKAVDAILAARAGAPVAATASAYADAVRGANAALINVVRPRLLQDVGVAPDQAGAPTTTG